MYLAWLRASHRWKLLKISDIGSHYFTLISVVCFQDIFSTRVSFDRKWQAVDFFTNFGLEQFLQIGKLSHGWQVGGIDFCFEFIPKREPLLKGPVVFRDDELWHLYIASFRLRRLR